jgi:hypothetical protein
VTPDPALFGYIYSSPGLSRWPLVKVY